MGVPECLPLQEPQIYASLFSQGRYYGAWFTPNALDCNQGKKELKKKISRNYTCFYRLWRKIFKNQVLIVVEVEAAAGGAHHRQIFCTDWKVNGIWLFLYGHWFQKRVRLCACACSIKQKQNLFSTYFRLLQYEIEQRSILECPKQHTAMFFPYSSYRNVIMYTTIIDRNYRLFGQEMCKGFGTNDKQEFAVLRLRVIFRQNAFLHSFHWGQTVICGQPSDTVSVTRYYHYSYCG